MEGIPPINERLAHLTPDQLEELLRRYYERAGSVPALMREFGISGNPSTFVRMLPPQIHADKECRFCTGQKLISDRRSRDHRGTEDPYCPKCGHRDSLRCVCQTCQARAWAKAKEIDQKKRSVVHSTFPLPDDPLLECNLLTLKEAVCLLALFRHSVSEDLSTAAPYTDRREKLSPNAELRDYAVSVLRREGILAVCPDSPLEAFVFNDDFTSCTGYYPGKVKWLFMPGVEQAAKRSFLADLERIARDGPWPDDWPADTFDLWHEIAKAECFEYYARQLAERGYEAEFGEKTQAVFDNLLSSFSIGQVFNLTWQAARDTTDYIVRNKLPKAHARNTFIGAIQRKADKHRAEGWETKAFGRNFECPQSLISSVFFDLFMGIGSKALEALPRERSNDLEEKEAEIPF